MFERNGLLDFWIDREVFAVEVSQAVVLPLQQIAGGGLGPCQQGSGKHQAFTDAVHSVAPKK